jgi:hypothetical protein
MAAYEEDGPAAPAGCRPGLLSSCACDARPGRDDVFQDAVREHWLHFLVVLVCRGEARLHPLRHPQRPQAEAGAAEERNLDYGDSYELPKTGRTIVVCHGDTALDPHAPALAYGKTWQQAGLKCTSKTVGLRCTNKSGHGFFLSRAHSYRF